MNLATNLPTALGNSTSDLCLVRAVSMLQDNQMYLDADQMAIRLDSIEKELACALEKFDEKNKKQVNDAFANYKLSFLERTMQGISFYSFFNNQSQEKLVPGEKPQKVQLRK